MPVLLLIFILFLPFLGTMLGGFLLLWKKESFHPTSAVYLNASAGGIMFASAIWSLLLPSLENSTFSPAWLPAIGGFLFGGILLALLEKLLKKSNEKEGNMLMLAVTLHNFPEGMAVGVALSSFLHGTSTLSAVFLLTLGIAIQNIPEGSIIYAPMRSRGKSRCMALADTLLSGIVEPIGALLALLLTSFFQPLLPFILAFAAGAMIFVVANEMMPEGKNVRHSSLPAIVFMFSFSLMLLLDVALG